MTMKDGNDKLIYPLLTTFVSVLLILPHSSACVERIFSTINLNKTKTRNRLSTESLSGILYSKNIIKSQDKSCYNFTISNEMVKKHTNDMYS